MVSWFGGLKIRLVTTVVFCVALGLLQNAIADTDVQTNNKQGREMTPLMPELSCAKKARRIKQLDNKMKRRKFIKQCRAEREIKLQAEKEAEEFAKQQKKDAEDKVFQDFLKKGKKRADKKIEEKKEKEEEEDE